MTSKLNLYHVVLRLSFFLSISFIAGCNNEMNLSNMQYAYKRKKEREIKCEKLPIIDINLLDKKVDEFNLCNAKGNWSIGKTIVILGHTGDGKSTLMSGIANEKLYAKLLPANKSYVKVYGIESHGASQFKISHETISETSIPQCLIQNNICYYDCPGFYDNRGVEADILNGLLIQKLFNDKLRKLVICILISQNRLENRSESGFLQILDSLEKMFPNVSEIKNSLVLVVTKTDAAKEEDFKEYLKCNFLKPDFKLSRQKVELLSSIISKNFPVVFFNKPTKEGPVDLFPIEDLKIKLKSVYGSRYFNTQVFVSDKTLEFLSLSNDNYVLPSLSKLCAGSNSKLLELVKNQIAKVKTSSSLKKDLQSRELTAKSLIFSRDIYAFSNYLVMLNQENIAFDFNELTSLKDYFLFISKINPKLSFNSSFAAKEYQDLLNILSLFSSPVKEIYNSKESTLVIKGSLIDSYEMTSLINRYNGVSIVKVYASEILLLNKEYFFAPELNLAIFAKNLIINCPRVSIELSGKSARNFGSNAKNGIGYKNGIDGQDGEDGLPGLPGGNSGNFFGYVSNKVLGRGELKIILNGGDGGNGQNGGDGANGRSGQDGSKYVSTGSKIYSGSGSKNLVCSDTWTTYCNEGTNGGCGGDSGKGGRGGYGGYKGNCSTNFNCKYSALDGNRGKDGDSGIAAKGGCHGDDYRRKYRRKEANVLGYITTGIIGALIIENIQTGWQGDSFCVRNYGKASDGNCCTSKNGVRILEPANPYNPLRNFNAWDKDFQSTDFMDDEYFESEKIYETNNIYESYRLYSRSYLGDDRGKCQLM